MHEITLTLKYIASYLAMIVQNSSWLEYGMAQKCINTKNQAYTQLVIYTALNITDHTHINLVQFGVIFSYIARKYLIYTCSG